MMVECWHQFMVKLVWLNQLVFTCNTSVVLNQENEWMDTNANFGMTFVAVVQLYDHGQTDTHRTWCCCGPGGGPSLLRAQTGPEVPQAGWTHSGVSRPDRMLQMLFLHKLAK